MHSYFENSYKEARDKFLQAASDCRAEITHHQFPLKSFSEPELFVDIARIGLPAAKRVMVIISGTHGIEGFCGSACQTAWLESSPGSEQHEITTYLIHALNPSGFASFRRV